MICLCLPRSGIIGTCNPGSRDTSPMQLMYYLLYCFPSPAPPTTLKDRISCRSWPLSPGSSWTYPLVSTTLPPCFYSSGDWGQGFLHARQTSSPEHLGFHIYSLDCFWWVFTSHSVLQSLYLLLPMSQSISMNFSDRSLCPSLRPNTNYQFFFYTAHGRSQLNLSSEYVLLMLCCHDQSNMKESCLIRLMVRSPSKLGSKRQARGLEQLRVHILICK